MKFLLNPCSQNSCRCEGAAHSDPFSDPVLFSVTGKTRELVVSAGESVEVTLPRNAVELNAFVVPAPTEGKAEEIGPELVTHCFIK